MAIFCTQCGAKLSPEQRFCTECGARVGDIGTEQAVSAQPANVEQPAINTAETIPEEKPPVQKAAQEEPQETETQIQEIIPDEKPKNIISEKRAVKEVSNAVLNSVTASDAVGEMSIGGFGKAASAFSSVFGTSSAVSGAFEILSPFTALFNGAKSFVYGLKNIKQNKRALVFSVIMAVIWIVLGRTQHTGFAGFLSTLTLSRGNIIGRVFTAAGLSSVLYGGVPRAARGIKGIFKNAGSLDIGSIVVGIGVSALIYGIIAGKLFSAGIMCGISGAFMALQALGSKGGFISNITAALTAKSGALDDSGYRSLLIGAAAGFLLSVLLAETYRRIRLVPSLIIIVAGVVLCFVLPKKGVAVNE